MHDPILSFDLFIIYIGEETVRNYTSQHIKRLYPKLPNVCVSDIMEHLSGPFRIGLCAKAFGIDAVVRIGEVCYIASSFLFDYSALFFSSFYYFDYCYSIYRTILLNILYCDYCYAIYRTILLNVWASCLFNEYWLGG